MKRFVFLLALLLAVFLGMRAEAATIVPAPSASGLVGYWSFNEGTSTKAADFSGNGNTGTLTNIAAPASATSGWGNGKLGNGINFDGTNDYVSAPHSSAYNFEYTNSFTLTAWVKKNTLNGSASNNFVVAKSENSGNFRGYYMVVRGDTGQVEVYLQSTSGAFAISRGTTAVNDDRWHHIVFVNTGTGTPAGMLIYVDGALETVSSSTNSLGGGTIVNSSPLNIGSRDSGGVPYKGAIDEVRVYSRALSAAEIANQYRAGATRRVSVSQSGLVGHWRLDEGTSTKAIDSSGNGNTGTLTNIAAPASATSGWGSGKLGGALIFDGTDDYVSATGQSLALGTGNFSISMWVNPRSFAAEASYFDSLAIGGAGQRNNAFTLVQSASTGRLRMFSAGAYSTASTGGPTLNQWNHILIVRNGSAVFYYINGQLDAATATLSTNVTSTSAVFGRYSDVAGGFFAGLMDDVRIYNRALSATEVASLYQSGQASRQHVSESGLVGYWSFNEATSTKVTDYSGNGRTGTLTNFASPSSATSGWATGKLGGALVFDGTNDYVDIGNTLDQTGASPFSVATWFKGTTAGVQSFVTKALIGGPYTGFTFGIDQVSGSAGLVGIAIVDNAGTILRRQTTTSYIDGQWHHAVFTYDGSKTRAGMLLYIDGALPTLTDHDSSSFTGTMSNSVSLEIGGRQTSNQPYRGSLDEVRYYSRALSASEIRTLYNLGR